jgi:hemerythrin-like domain-containing protein
MKRKKEFVTLSWEHHDGLVFAFRLQQGVKKEADPKIVRQYILETWDSALDHHFWQEEHILTTPLNESNAGQKKLQRMLDEHSYFRGVIEEFRKEEIADPQKIHEFADHLNKHIRFEELDLFPFLEGTLSDLKLNAIGDFLNEHHKKPAKCRTQAFWAKSN